jgi:hypothetical protein
VAPPLALASLAALVIAARLRCGQALRLTSRPVSGAEPRRR